MVTLKSVNCEATLNANTSKGIPGKSYKALGYYYLEDYATTKGEHWKTDFDICLIVVYDEEGNLPFPTCVFSEMLTSKYCVIGRELTIKGYNIKRGLPT
jgi:hypothetical protein